MPPPTGAAARALRVASSLLLLTAMCAVTLLDLGDVLEHVLAHLPGRARQELRSTCRALRTHQAILDSATRVTGQSETVPDSPVDWRLLASLPRLAHLTLNFPASLFRLHHVSGLRSLTRLTISSADRLDLTPLNCMTQLRYLCLDNVEDFTDMKALQLSHFTKLRLEESSSGKRDRELTCLTRLRSLAISDAVHAPYLKQLQQLTELQVIWDDVNLDAVFAAARHLPALRLLRSAVLCKSVTTLTRLTALLLRAGHEGHVSDVHDLTALPQLRRLGLEGQHWAGEDEYPGVPILAPHITTLFLNMAEHWGGPTMLLVPRVATCHRLEHVMLRLETASLLLLVSHLPLQQLRVSVQTEKGQVFLQMGLEQRVSLRAVKKVSFLKEPVTF